MVAKTQLFHSGSVVSGITALVLVLSLPGCTLDSVRDSDSSTPSAEVDSEIAALVTMATLGPDRIVEPGAFVSIELRLPFDYAKIRDGFSVQWQLEQRPIASEGVVLGEANEIELRTDVPGRYAVLATVTNSATGSRHQFRTNVVADTPRSGGVRLFGDASERLIDTTFDWVPDVGFDRDAISTEARSGTRVLRNEIDIEFHEDAVLGQVNAVLEDIEGGVIAMLRRSSDLMVRIPDPGSLDALNRILERIERMDGVLAADANILLESGALPGNISPGSGADMIRIQHHLAVRGHGAWNMRDGLPGSIIDRPLVLIADFYGDGMPDNDYASLHHPDNYESFPLSGDDSGCDEDASCRHGYHVLGIMQGLYDADPGGGDRAQITGLYPESLRVASLDLSRKNSTGHTRRSIVSSLNAIVDADSNARIVVNTSIFSIDASESFINRQARRYRNAIRDNNLEHRVVHATIAGNAQVDDDGNIITWPARLSSGYAYATLGEITKLGFSSGKPLDNILVVENRVVDTSGARPVPGCLSNSSLHSGNISGIGTGVWSFGRIVKNDDDDTIGQDGKEASSAGGTSMASPQVAALAALVWSFDDSLTGPELVDRLIDSGRMDTASGCNTTPQPVIDALNALRSGGGQNARRTLLDVATGTGFPGSDGVFDEQDIQQLLTSWENAGTSLAYGRHDINADGVTDGAPESTRTGRVDLDGDGILDSDLTLDLEGYEHSFNEYAVTDLDVLCFGAWEPGLYQGSEWERNRLLGQPCGIVDITITDPPEGATYTIGDNVEVRAEVTINSQHSGDITLHTGGEQVDERTNWQHNFTLPVTLDTRRVCVDDPEVTIRFADNDSGLMAEDSVGLNMQDAQFGVHIFGPRPRYVPLDMQGIEDVTLRGRLQDPTCNDPLSKRLDHDELAWHDPQGNPVPASGPQLRGEEVTLDSASYLDDGDGGYQSRYVVLHDEVGGSHTDQVQLIPCTSSFGQEQPAPALPSGYTECPTGAVIGRLFDNFLSTFGVDSVRELNRQIAIALHGIPRYRDLLDEPCDPTHCDPVPPYFPADRAATLESLAEWGYTETARGYLGQFGNALDQSTDIDSARTGVGAVMHKASGSLREMSDFDRALLLTAYSIIQGTLDYFDPHGAAGINGWSGLMPEAQLRTFLQRGDVVAPVRGALDGYLTAIDGSRFGSNDFSEEALDAAEYGAVLGAVEVHLGFREDDRIPTR